MGKPEKNKKLPKYFERIYHEIGEIFQTWTTEQNLEPIILEVGNQHSTFTYREVNATGVFWCNRPNRKVPEYPPQQDLAGENLPFVAELDLYFTLSLVSEEDGLVDLSIVVKHAQLAEPAVLLAKKLEEHLKSWLPPNLIIPEKVLVKNQF
jgi:hypothetical protein